MFKSSEDTCRVYLDVWVSLPLCTSYLYWININTGSRLWGRTQTEESSFPKDVPKMTKHISCHLSNHSSSRGIWDKSVLSFKEKLSPQMLLIHRSQEIQRYGIYEGVVGIEPAPRGFHQKTVTWSPDMGTPSACETHFQSLRTETLPGLGTGLGYACKYFTISSRAYCVWLFHS